VPRLLAALAVRSRGRDTGRAMSEENVEVVRGLNDPYEGEDVMPGIRAAVAHFGPDPDPAVVLAWWADDPGWRHVSAEVEWDTTAIAGIGSKVRGPTEVALWWADWTNAWERYVYRTLEYRDVGEFVLTKSAVEARGPGGRASRNDGVPTLEGARRQERRMPDLLVRVRGARSRRAVGVAEQSRRDLDHRQSESLRKV
jgi:hypothetical protein